MWCVSLLQEPQEASKHKAFYGDITMEKTLYISLEIKTELPIEAVKEHLSVYCEKMGDVKVTHISIYKNEVNKNGKL